MFIYIFCYVIKNIILINNKLKIKVLMNALLRFLLGEPAPKRFCTDRGLAINYFYSNSVDLMDMPEDLLIRILGLVKQHILCFRVASRDCFTWVDTHSFLKTFVVEHRLLKKMSEALHLVIKVDENLVEVDDDDSSAVKYDILIQDGWYYKILGLKDPAVALKLLDENETKVVNHINCCHFSHIEYKLAKREFLLNKTEDITNLFTTHVHFYKYQYFCNKEGVRENLDIFKKFFYDLRNHQFQVIELWKFIISKNPKLAFQAFKQEIETNNPESDRELINTALFSVHSHDLDPFFGQDWNASIELVCGDVKIEWILLSCFYRKFQKQLKSNHSGLVKDELYKTVGQLVTFNGFTGANLNETESRFFFDCSIDLIFSFNTYQILEIVNQMFQIIDDKIAETVEFDQNKFLASYIILAKLKDRSGIRKLIEKYRNCLFSLKTEELKESLSFTMKLSEDMETLLQGANEKTAALKFNEIVEIYSNINGDQPLSLTIFVTLLVHLIDKKQILEWITSCKLSTQIKILGLLAENTYFKEETELLKYIQSLIQKKSTFSPIELSDFFFLLGRFDVNATFTLMREPTWDSEQLYKNYKIDLLTHVVKFKIPWEELSDNHLAAAELLLAELDNSILCDNLKSYLSEETSDDQVVNLRRILMSFVDGKYIDSAFNFLQKIEGVLDQKNIAPEMRGVYFVKLVEDIKFLKRLR